MKSASLKATWRGVALRILASAILVVLVGLLLDAVLLCLVIALTAFMGWQLWNLYRLDRWLKTRKRREPPEGLGVWTTIFDALYQRQRESAQRRARLAMIVKEFRDATNALPDAVIVLNREHQIRWFNPGAADLIGLRKRQDTGRPIVNLIRNPEFQSWLRGGLIDPNGLVLNSPLDASVKLRLRMFDYGEDQRILLARDITDIQRIEAMRKDFVANVSHELRTPLTVISGYIETMGHGLDSEWAPVVERVEQQCARMKAIVEDLLTLSRLDATSSLEEDAVVLIEPLINSLVSETKVLSNERHRIRLEAQAGLDLRGSSKDLRSAFMNLLANAVRYTPEGGEISVYWREDGDHAELEVADNGPGIAAQHLPRITERFYRVSSDRSRASGGTGLGLAIVKHILALHDADLVILSEPGRGSRFICRFPPERVSRRLSRAS